MGKRFSESLLRRAELKLQYVQITSDENKTLSLQQRDQVAAYAL